MNPKTHVCFCSFIMTPWCSQHTQFYSPDQPYSYLMIITIFLLLTLPYSSSLEFDFQALDQNNRTLMTQGNTTYLPSSEIELTTNKQQQIGHVKYFEDMKLWDKDSGRQASFKTSFSFIIYSSPNQTLQGDGIAFFLAQPPFNIPNITVGSRMGLIGGDDPVSNAGSFVAVEFDTFRNGPSDPFDRIDPQHLAEHVGIDVNSMASRKTASWSCNIKTWKVYNATVSYSSRTKNFSVSFTGYKGDVLVQQSLSDEINLAEYLPERVTIGFSAANGVFASRHILRSWSFHSEELSTSTNSKTGLVVGLSVGACVFVGALGLIYFGLWKWKKKSIKEEDEEEGIIDAMDEDFEMGTGPKRFSYKELAMATDNFSDEGKLGQGGFGGVYKGFLPELNMEIAVKKISSTSKQGKKEYISEVKTISRLRHRNLVQLVGWSHERGNFLLVYEYMPNGSLDTHLFGKKLDHNNILSWPLRYKIIHDLAAGMLYLHEEWEQCVVHRDIKASNVMLDSNFTAKLGDFGLAKFIDHELGSQTTVVAGTKGYMAPEYLITSKASKESDVFSFGIVALEIGCGRKAVEPKAEESKVSLVNWVWGLNGKGRVLEAADEKLDGKYDSEEMCRLLKVGLWCAHPDHSLRPSIRQAIQVLKFETPLPSLPTQMPVLMYFSQPPNTSDLVSSYAWSGPNESLTIIR